MIEVIIFHNVDKTLFKLQNPRLSHILLILILILMPYLIFQNLVFSIVKKFLKKHNFKVIFPPPINKLSLSKLKDPIDTLISWGIYNISCQCGLSYIGQIKCKLRFRLYEYTLNILHPENSKSVIVTHIT